MKLDKKSEYATLRNELIGTINMQVTLLTVMYTATIAVLGLAMHNRNAYLCLLAFLILIPLQVTINNKRRGMLKLGAYITIFHEDGKQWESVNREFHNRLKLLVPKKRKITSFLNKTSSSQLGVVASALSLYLHFSYPLNHNLVLSVLYVCVVVSALCILFYANRSAFQNDATIKRYESIMREIKHEQMSEEE